MRRSQLLLLLLCLLLPTTSRAFDWAGKQERDLKLLRSPSPTVRRQAVSHLGRYPTAQVKRYILQALRDIDPSVQRAAASVAAEKRLLEARPILVSWLSHWDDDLRISAASALGRIGGKGSISTLVRALVDPEPKVRLKIVEALGALGHKNAVVPLLGRLEDTNSDVRQAALTVLGALKDRRAVIPLMGRLNDPSRQIRASAAQALGKLGDPRSGPGIVRLLSDHATQVVQAAIDALGALRYPGAAEALIELFRTGSYTYRDRAARALAAIGSDLSIRALVDALDNSSLRTAAKAALSASTRQEPKHINRLLKDPRTTRSVAIVAVEIARDAKLVGAVPHLVEQLALKRLPATLVIGALGAIGDARAQRPLLAHLQDSSVEVRLAALRALEPIIDRRAAEPLVQCLGDKHKEMRWRAIDYLGRLRSRLATKPLLAIARGSDLPEARHAAAAVAAIGDPRAIDDLLALLTHSDRLLRRLAVQALSTVKTDPAVATRTLALCRRQNADVRANCLQALGGLLRGKTEPRVLTYLLENARSKDHSLFLAAVDGLAAVRDARAARLLLSRASELPLELRRRAIEAVGNQPDARSTSIPRLIALLQGKESSVSAAAAWSLGKLQAKRAGDALTLAARGSGWAPRINATAAIARLRQPRYLPLLRTLLADKDQHVRANAALGLGWLGDKPSTAPLLKLLQRDRSPWVRSNALRALWLLEPARPRLPGTPASANMKALTLEISKMDPDRRLRRLAKAFAETPPKPPTRHESWIGLYLLDRQGHPLRDKAILLITPAGLVKATYSDVRAQAWEERLPLGRCFVELPPRAALPTSSTVN